MSPKAIRPDTTILSCAVCGRRLLQGETPETYLVGGSRRTVCELCTTRANHQGWIRETAGLQVGHGGSVEGGGLFDRLRARRESRRPANGDEPVAGEGNGADAESFPEAATAAEADAPEPEPVRRSAPRAPEPAFEVPHQPRTVHAVPTSGELKTARALELFNNSEHPRTIAGVARSLGEPAVLVRPNVVEASVVTIIVAWELCWYRYEVDLAEEGTHGVRVAGQGYELTELPEEDQAAANAAADEHGSLALAA